MITIDERCDYTVTIDSIWGDDDTTYQYGVSSDPNVQPTLNGTDLTLAELAYALTGLSFKRLRIQINFSNMVSSFGCSYSYGSNILRDEWRLLYPIDIETKTSSMSMEVDGETRTVYRLQMTARENGNLFPIFVYRKIEGYNDRFQWTANTVDLAEIGEDDSDDIYRFPAIDLRFLTLDKLNEVQSYLELDFDKLRDEFKNGTVLPYSENYIFEG